MPVRIPDHVPPERIRDVDIYCLPGQNEDFHAAWKALQDSSPNLIWTPRNEGHWIALRGEVLSEVQSNHVRFSSRVIKVPKSIGELQNMIPTTVDPPEHRPYRILLNERLAPGAVRGMREHVRQTAISLIDSFRTDGYCDFKEQYAQIFPIKVFMHLVGLPMADVPRLKIWAESMTRPNPPMPFEQGRAALFDYIAPVVAIRRLNPDEDLVSHIANAEIQGRKLSDEEAVKFVAQVMVAGLDTVVNFLSFAFRHLAHDATARHFLAQDPARILPAVHELFRRYGLVTIGREVRVDTVLDGVLLKAGEMVSTPTQVHGLDERANVDPMRVDFARKRPRHSAFGSGPHMCPGQELARLEVATTIEEWLKRIPNFTIAEDADTSCAGGIVGQINRLTLCWDPAEPA